MMVTGGRRRMNILQWLRISFGCLSLACVIQLVAHQPTFEEYPTLIYVAPRSGVTSSHTIPTNGQDLPKFVVDPFFRQEQDKIDNSISDRDRCAQYGVEALPEHKKNQRRIFFGSMLANENPEVVIAHAIEVHNKYDVIALVESNTTHYATPRTLNYGKGSMNARKLIETELFGSKTKVVIDYWMVDEPDLLFMDREVEQRNLIWKLWVDQGMSRGDVGIMSDLDEVVSRDFLNAIQVCDFPKLNYDPQNVTKPSCQTPKMCLSSIQFESSPLCVKKNEWHHPDIIIGNCVLGVGDPSGRVTSHRRQRLADGTPAGFRTEEWGKSDYRKYPQDVIENQRFPLWEGRDIRGVNGNADKLVNFVNAKTMGMGETAAFGAAYHFHNWFQDLSVLRHKYATYGHADQNAVKVPLSNITGDLDMLVRCARGLGNKIPKKVGIVPHKGFSYYTNNTFLPQAHKGNHNKTKANDNATMNLFSLGGNRPIYFRNQTYVEERHALLQFLVAEDEKKFGSIYKETVV